MADFGRCAPEYMQQVTGVFDSFLIQVPENTPVEEVVEQVGKASKFDIGDKYVEFRFSVGTGKSWREAQKSA